jgi:hypothetical protein
LPENVLKSSEIAENIKSEWFYQSDNKGPRISMVEIYFLV